MDTPCPPAVISDGVQLRVPLGENTLQHKNVGGVKGAKMVWEIYRPHVGTVVELLTGVLRCLHKHTVTLETCR
jgi:hypothetical protein